MIVDHTYRERDRHDAFGAAQIRSADFTELGLEVFERLVAEFLSRCPLRTSSLAAIGDACTAVKGFGSLLKVLLLWSNPVSPWEALGGG